MSDPEIDLIPVRALNQVTYCPRLYYLEYVKEGGLRHRNQLRSLCLGIAQGHRVYFGRLG